MAAEKRRRARALNLIVYYSRKGENYWNGTIRGLPKGNTELAA